MEGRVVLVVVVVVAEVCRSLYERDGEGENKMQEGLEASCSRLGVVANTIYTHAHARPRR